MKSRTQAKCKNIIIVFFFIFIFFSCMFSSWRLEQLWLSWLKINASNSWGATHTRVEICV